VRALRRARNSPVRLYRPAHARSRSQLAGRTQCQRMRTPRGLGPRIPTRSRPQSTGGLGFPTPTVDESFQVTPLFLCICRSSWADLLTNSRPNYLYRYVDRRRSVVHREGPQQSER
jgi:hypothetical protein